MGIPAATLEKTLKVYSEQANAQKDPVLHYTMGGLEIDPESRVLTATDHSPVPGLFAAGEVVDTAEYLIMLIGISYGLLQEHWMDAYGVDSWR